MTEAAIISIINEICAKLGTTAEYIIPKLSEMKFYSSFFGAVVSGIFVIVFAILIIFNFIQLAKRKYDFNDTFAGLFWINCIFELPSIIICIINSYYAFMWNKAPEAMVITYIIDNLSRK